MSDFDARFVGYSMMKVWEKAEAHIEKARDAGYQTWTHTSDLCTGAYEIIVTSKKKKETP